MSEESKRQLDEEKELYEEHFDREEVDPELMELAGNTRRGSVLRPILFVAVIVLGISIISDWRESLAYFFSPSEPVHIGTVTDFPAKRAEDPSWQPDIPHNRYVKVEGVPSRRSESKRYRFFKLVGGHVYVEWPRPEQDPLEAEFGEKEKGDIDRTFFEGAGRAVHFSKMSERYQRFRAYYSERYGTNFCGVADGAKIEAADGECVEAYLIQGGVEPSDHWWHVLMAGVMGVFVVLNVWWLFKWLRDFFRA